MITASSLGPQLLPALSRVAWGLLGLGLIYIFLRVLLFRLQAGLLGLLLRAFNHALTSGKLDSSRQQPRSLSVMDGLLAPQLQSDFPDLNIHELREAAKEILLQTLKAKDLKDSKLLGLQAGAFTLAPSYREQLRQELLFADPAAKQEVIYRIHRCVLSHYRRQEGLCELRLQLAYEARNSAQDQGPPRQERAELTLHAYTDLSRYSEQAPVLNLSCPHCGSGLKSSFSQLCPYCGSRVMGLAKKIWIFTAYQWQ